jgi:peptidyl-prolyl cis-trans isomerase SurA
MSDVGKLLEDKLYAHQAIQDSVKVTDAEVRNDGGTIELHGHSNRIFGQSNKVLQEKSKKNLEAISSIF